MLVAAAAMLLLSACGEAAPTTTGNGSANPDPEATAAATGDEAPPTAEASSAAASTPSSADAGRPAADAFADARLFGIADVGAGLVAVGTRDDAAAAWTTDDGQTWREAEVARARSAGRLRAVAAGPDGLVAFGGADDVPSRVWTSEDGSAWTPQSGGDLGARINAATYAGGRWLAVGDVLGSEGGEAVAGAVFESSDGEAWRSVTEGLEGSEITVTDITVGDLTVVSGFDVSGGSIWLDPAADGQRLTDGFAGTTIQGVAATADGFYALGRGIADLVPIGWTSADGRTWQQLDVDPQAFPPTTEIHDLVASGDGLMAVGASEVGGVIWTTDDGRAWTMQP